MEGRRGEPDLIGGTSVAARSDPEARGRRPGHRAPRPHQTAATAARSRRRFVGALAAAAAGAARATAVQTTVITLGDSILDCAHYNAQGVHPGQLLVRNDDELFPEFRGRDLSTAGPAVLVHRARDGATVVDLAAQARGLQAPAGRAFVLLTIGGNDLLRGLVHDDGKGVGRFEAALDDVLRGLRLGPVFVATVYDPTFGDDRRNFVGAPPAQARANHARVNEVLRRAAGRHGVLVDLHAHFLSGRPDWFTNTIEPSLTGASEVRRVFWAAIARRVGRLPP